MTKLKRLPSPPLSPETPYIAVGSIKLPHTACRNIRHTMAKAPRKPSLMFEC